MSIVGCFFYFFLKFPALSGSVVLWLLWFLLIIKGLALFQWDTETSNGTIIQHGYFNKIFKWDLSLPPHPSTIYRRKISIFSHAFPLANHIVTLQNTNQPWIVVELKLELVCLPYTWHLASSLLPLLQTRVRTTLQYKMLQAVNRNRGDEK